MARLPVICAQCGNLFQPKKFGAPPKYCSAKCQEQARPKTEKRKQQSRLAYHAHYLRNKEEIIASGNAYLKAHPEKQKQYLRTYREKNREKVRENNLLSYYKNRDSALARQQEYHKANVEKEKQYRQSHREEGNKRAREWQARYREGNREENRRKQKEWRERNPETYRAKEHRRRTKQTEAGGNYTAKEWEVLLEACGNRCLCCGRGDVKLTVDHIVPVSLGGSSNIDNIQPLCLSCNARKNNKVIDFRRAQCR